MASLEERRRWRLERLDEAIERHDALGKRLKAQRKEVESQLKDTQPAVASEKAEKKPDPTPEPQPEVTSRPENAVASTKKEDV